MCISDEDKLLCRLLEAIWDEKGNGQKCKTRLILTRQSAVAMTSFKKGHQHWQPDKDDPEKEWSSFKTIPYYFLPRNLLVTVRQLALAERNEALLHFIRSGDGSDKNGGKIKQGREGLKLIRLPSGKYEIHWYEEHGQSIKHRFEEREVVE